MRELLLLKEKWAFPKFVATELGSQCYPKNVKRNRSRLSSQGLSGPGQIAEYSHTAPTKFTVFNFLLIYFKSKLNTVTELYLVVNEMGDDQSIFIR